MTNSHNLPLPTNEIDSTSLNGLRGLASIHIMMHHYYINATTGLNLISSFEVSLFFLLSGFTLALAYGKTTYQRATFWQTASEGSHMFNSLKFYQNRFARIGPLYYLTNALCLTCKCSTQCIQGSANFWKTFILTYTMTNAWTFFGIQPGGQLNHVWAPFPFEKRSWFITTISFFYLIFPRLLPALQTLSTNQLSSLIVWLFHIQCIPALLSMRGNGSSLFWMNNGHPLIRLPVFVMGVAAGLIRVKGIHQDFNANRNFLYDIFPWGFSQPDTDGSISTSSEQLESTWRWKVDRNSLLLIALIIAENTFGTYWPDKFFGNQTNTWATFFCIHMLLVIIVGLTQDGGKSIMSKIMRFRPIKFLGTISLAIYLLHVYVLDFYWQQFGMNKKTNKTIAISTVTTLVVSAIITKIFTEPLQNLLKAKK